ncbi:hypothetical protein D104_07550 [Marinomonas profundimaris]|uniref:Uncharacterized protein n=1 Tax=Marinomonas profundimaris TaxID=1208321 RepID=W1S178_9GAMM|nr:hypothetical protein D104_07550 [Marinomonas profundimaris]
MIFIGALGVFMEYRRILDLIVLKKGLRKMFLKNITPQ